MSDETLEAFGKRWNRRQPDLVFEPEDAELKPGAIELGIPALDELLAGGIPRGRTSIFFGAEAAGKTLLSQLVIAAAQRQGGIAVFADIERTFDAKWFGLTGVDLDPKKLIIVRPDSLEQAFDMAEDAMRTVQPDVLVLDSIAALVPQAQLDVEMSKQDFRGLSARKTTEGVKKLTLANKKTALIIINQMRIDMGVTFGSPENMPGGRALRHAASIIIRIRRGQWLTDVAERKLGREEFTAIESKKGDAKRVGFMLKLNVEKNKLATPWQDIDVKFFFSGEVDPLGSLIHLAVQRSVIEVTGKGYYQIPDTDKVLHGLGAVEVLLRMDEQLKNKIIRLVRETRYA